MAQVRGNTLKKAMQREIFVGMESIEVECEVVSNKPVIALQCGVF